VLDSITDMHQRAARLCELNVIEQALNVAQTTVVRDAWERGQTLRVHSWIYSLDDGRVRDLGLHVSASSQLETASTAALSQLDSIGER
jgi:carbonic anhydrase